jgi:sugar lactone lactonase YvrE
VARVIQGTVGSEFLIMKRAFRLVVVVSAMLPFVSVDIEALPVKQDSRLIPVYQANRVWNGITTSKDGRAFASFPDADGPGVKLQELTSESKASPYPNPSWNSWKPGQDPKAAFVHVNALRIGPDGVLWVVDAGAPGLGKPAVSGAARIIGFDLSTNQVSRIYTLTQGTKKDSYIDDIRFNGGYGYITDAGAPGLLVLNLKTGAVRRVLDNDPSTIDSRPMMADGKILRDEKGKELRLHADQIEISPDGKYVYYQPACGPLARIETRWLNDETLAPTGLAGHVEKWLDTPTSGGTAIDSDGTIYYGDANQRRILKISPDKSIQVLISDPRLIWSDAMWIDQDGFLWIPATQQNLTPGFTGGKQQVRYPVWIYKMQLGIHPAPNDHA